MIYSACLNSALEGVDEGSTTGKPFTSNDVAIKVLVSTTFKIPVAEYVSAFTENLIFP